MASQALSYVLPPHGRDSAGSKLGALISDDYISAATTAANGELGFRRGHGFLRRWHLPSAPRIFHFVSLLGERERGTMERRRQGK
uniref:Uncharacterized protein n=1 Tax=Oryza punctata TaxID=4537 RepID=A0A0E0M242_ORYPU